MKLSQFCHDKQGNVEYTYIHNKVGVILYCTIYGLHTTPFCLNKELHLEVIDDLWKIASPLLERGANRTSPLYAKKPVIVIEGLDGTGKIILYVNMLSIPG